MNALNAADLHALFYAFAGAIETDKDRLSALDGVIGDGDHGITMSIGFQAVVEALGEKVDPSLTPSDIFMLAAKTFLNAVGASAGPLYATGFMQCAAAVKGKDNLEPADMADIISAMAEGIVHRGKAERGEKTMVDAWGPAADAAQAARANNDFVHIVGAAAQAAQQGAQATQAMRAQKGRAANLGERAVGHIDPGAASAALLLQKMEHWVEHWAEHSTQQL